MLGWSLLALHALSFVFLVLLLVGVIHTISVEHGPRLDRFRSGRAPHPLPNRLYLACPGQGHRVGENFDASCALGNDVFRKDGAYKEKHFFRMYVTGSVRDREEEVLTLDYDIPANPFWIRCLLCELVEVAPKTLFGKRYVRVIPGYPFTLGYIELQREY